MKKRYLSQIPDGEPLQEDLYNERGLVLVARGKVMTPKLRQQLLRHNVEYFLVDITGYEQVDAQLEQFDPEVAKQIEQVRQVYIESFQSVSIEFEQIRKRGTLDKGTIREIAEELVESIGHYQQVYLGLEGIRRKDFYTYIHSVDVAIYMIVLGKSMKMEKKQQQKAAMAGLLHDIGKTRIDDSILMKPGPLTHEEMSVMQQHARMGHDILLNELNYPRDVAAAALEHHERMDGTGYPQGVLWDQLHPYSKMAAICDIYDAITGERVYKKAMLPHEAAEFLMTLVDRHLERTLTNQFIRNIALYPLGTRVTLNNQEEGIVTRIHDGYPARPVVRIPSKKLDRDLLTETTLMIEKVHGIHQEAAS